MQKLLFVTLTSLFLTTALRAENEIDKNHRMITELISTVKIVNATFIRNGSEHTPTEAANHIERKYSYARKKYTFMGPVKNITPEQFIEHIASKSSTTGKDYHIKFDGFAPVKMKDWLERQLNLIRQREKESVGHSGQK